MTTGSETLSSGRGSSEARTAQRHTGTPSPDSFLLWFADIDAGDVARVGGKGASLGEMHRHLVSVGVRVPDGFVTTARAHDAFLDATLSEDQVDPDAHEDHVSRLLRAALRSGTLREGLGDLFRGVALADDVDVNARARAGRALIMSTPIPSKIGNLVREAYQALCQEYGREVDAAVRSSATREDSEVASFAGQYESYLNVRGADDVMECWRKCVASGFTNRAVSYQLRNGMDPLGGAVSVVIMKMVRSDIATSGVMFTLDPDSGNTNVVHITSAYGLGELVVQGEVSPDTFLVWKEGLRRGRPALVHRRLGAKDRKMVYSSQGGTATESVDVEASRQRSWSLTKAEVLELARMALLIEEHYGRAMDIEWAKDGYSGELFVVQARPETVHSNGDRKSVLRTYSIRQSLVDRLRDEGKVLLEGEAVGTRIASGKVRVYESYEEVIRRKRRLRNVISQGTALEDVPPEERVFDQGDVLVTELTTPDWEPLMKNASLIITERGGRTSHAAIVAREFGIPAIVGCGDAARVLEPLMEITGTCAQGDRGLVLDGIQPFEVQEVEVDLNGAGELDTAVKLNVGFPERALADAMLPSEGVGLARLEFILTAQVGIHPLALLYFEDLRDYLERGELTDALAPFHDRLRKEEDLKGIISAIERRTAGYGDRRQFFVDQVGGGIALICAAFHPRPVLVRLSDLKSNEYRDLLGGRLFEPVEENPMIAWRGAARYTHPSFAPAFDMECEALRFVRQNLGLDNLQVMVPFCRTPEEGRDVLQLLDQRGLSPRGGVDLFLMVELPSNVLDAERFIDEMELAGGSIGSNDLVQTVYALSRDDMEDYPRRVDARSPAVKMMIRTAVKTFRARGLEIGICGQAPSDHPEEVPSFLVECGISSISVTPDTLVKVRMAVREAEKSRNGSGPREG